MSILGLSLIIAQFAYLHRLHSKCHKNIFQKFEDFLKSKDFPKKKISKMSMQRQVWLKVPNGPSRLVRLTANATAKDLLRAAASLVPQDQDVMLLASDRRRPLEPSDVLFENQSETHPPTFYLCPRMRGGKGGFGSMLRSQGGRMAKKRRGEKKNVGSCRDLSGRRLRTMQDAQLYVFFERANSADDP